MLEPAVGPNPWKRRPDPGHERAAKRRAVLLAAARAFTARGFHHTSLDDVARQLHVTKPTLYHYFRSKEQILFECFKVGLAELDVAFGKIENERLPGRDRLIAFLREYGAIVMSDLGAPMALVHDHELSPPYRARIRRLKAGIDLRIRSLVDAGVRDGSIAAGEQKLRAFAMAGALNWTAHWFRAGGSLSRARVGRAFTDFFVSGLAPRRP